MKIIIKLSKMNNKMKKIKKIQILKRKMIIKINQKKKIKKKNNL